MVPNQKRRALCLPCTFLLDQIAGFNPPDEAAEQALREIRATERELASVLAFPARRSLEL